MSLIIWSLVWAAACSSPGLEVRAASILSTEPGAVDPPWLAIFHCFQSDSPTVCFQKRAVRALEDMFIKEDVDDKSVEQEEKGLSPAVGKIIDRIGDLIASGLSQWYPESDGEPEDLDTAKSADAIDQVRGHKKKVHKAMKKLVIKLLIFLYVKQQAIRLFLYSAQTFILFKFMVFAGVYVLTNVVKVLTFVKWHHHEKHAPKVLYIEPQIKHVTQHHAHVAPYTHHEEYTPEGYEYEPAPDQDSFWPRSDNAHRIVYRNQIPAKG